MAIPWVRHPALRLPAPKRPSGAPRERNADPWRVPEAARGRGWRTTTLRESAEEARWRKDEEEGVGEEEDRRANSHDDKTPCPSEGNGGEKFLET